MGQRLDGKYDIECVVAEGGFGVVYRATHRALQKLVAVKVLKVPTTLSDAARAEFLDKFALEARTIARFEHPAIVRVMDFGASPMPRGETAPWMVLEWLDGTSLEAHLEARGAGHGIDPSTALRMLEPVFEAIAYAHDEGVVHRDLKPANLMLSRSRRGEASWRVLDFGIAKLMGAEERTSSGFTATSSAMQAFSLPYAAPEQLTAMRTGPWTDVHALALILVEVLTGFAPFTGNDVAELFAASLAPQRPTPRFRGVDVGAWEPVLARALAFKPAERFPDARAFLVALRAALPGACWRPLVAGGVSPPQSYLPAPAPSTLQGAARVNMPSASGSAWLLVGVAGGLMALVTAVGWAVATRGVPLVTTHAASPLPSSTTSVSTPVMPIQTVDPIAAEASDAGVTTVHSEAASGPPSEGARVRPRPSARAGAVRGARGAVVGGGLRPSSSEQLPVE
ncbi:MAG: protein kinase [Polyangiales bacterium]